MTESTIEYAIQGLQQRAKDLDKTARDSQKSRTELAKRFAELREEITSRLDQLDKCRSDYTYMLDVENEIKKDVAKNEAALMRVRASAEFDRSLPEQEQSNGLVLAQ